MSLSPAAGPVPAAIGSGGTAGPPRDRRGAGHSPGRLAWLRLRADRTALASGAALVLFLLVALAAPLIELTYGIGPRDQFQDRLDGFGLPLGRAGGVSGEHFFGLEPRLGRDIFIRLVYGLRTSLFVALAAAVLTSVIGVVLGTLAGYLGGWLDAVVTWITDLTLALPFLVVALVLPPMLTLRFYGQRDTVPAAFGVGVLIVIFAVFGWTGTARLIRGQVIALREREFVAAARASGAGPWHMLFRELLPNLRAPILVSFSLTVPQFVTGEAALSFIGVGLTEETPSFGRMIYQSLEYLQTDPAFVLFPGVVIFALVLAVNLFGDALRDALDPKSAG
ncbi:ABC transporter permease [Micromonospora andamanensis]|uniref:Peptide ABC transporter permease n=1 Tax=Micromonospora andamanensis TaxID=1287068 RepID=A0ABQ4HXS1_9ACTN|nr:ABC transporter permease [Micromonospora andamanensis]GIJ10432.1 peptide ABC transporter permease [Micromonospora andamanensis]